MDRRVAIIGAACRLPGGARSPEDLWDLLRRGVDAVGPAPPGRFPPVPEGIPHEGGFLADHPGDVDTVLFRLAPGEARQLDPQQRLLLEVAWEALERAGRAPDGLVEAAVGIYVGMGLTDYARRGFLSSDPFGDPTSDRDRIDPWSGTGSFTSVAAGRLAYLLGTRGPALAVHTACSSSLVALHLASRALRSAEIDLAIAGGVSLILAPEPTLYFHRLGALSPDGRCRTFDADADGYGRAEGCALVVLARHDDAVAAGSPLLALIRGSAVNQDGRTNGLTAPSGRAQQEVLRAALRDAEVPPDQVVLLEAHGTATPLGDPIELEAARAVYGAGTATCWVRSIKTNLGHLEAAAGIAGLLQAALALRHRQVPAHLHLRTLNPRVDLAGTRMRIPTELVPLDGSFAAVSSFGLAGTNAHLILEAAPPARPATAEGPAVLLALSAPDEAHLAALAASWAGDRRPTSAVDLAWTAVTARARHPERLAVVARDAATLRARLADPGQWIRGRASRRPRVVFAYPGQGSQRAGLGQRLHARFPAFRLAFDACDAVFFGLRGRSLREACWPPEGGEPALLGRTEWTQPALFALEWALTALLRDLGIEPDAVVGHSVGELVAAVAAGVMSPEDGMALVTERGRLLGELPPLGAMAAALAGPAVVEPLLAPGAEIAARNGPWETVVSGPVGAIAETAARLGARGVVVRRLEVSHAFHSDLVTPALAEWARVVEALPLRAPELPLVSCLAGGGSPQDHAHWVAHLRQPVDFSAALTALAPDDLVLEVGPGAVLAGLGARAGAATWIGGLLPGERDEEEQLLARLGQLVVRGPTPRWERLFPEGAHLVEASTTVFVRTRHWLEPVGPPQVDAPALRLVLAPAPEAPRNGRAFEIEGSEAAELVAALGALGARAVIGGGDPGPEVEQVVLLGPLDDDAVGPALGELAARLGAGRLTLLTAGATEADPDPAHAALWGLAAVAEVEAPERFGRVLDRHRGSGPADWAAALLRDDRERVAVTAQGPLVARLVEAPGAASPLVVRSDGAYLVTGGFGGIGLAVARLLAERGAGELVLLSRRGADGDPARQAAVAELRGRGTRVVAPTGDAAREEDLAAALVAATLPVRGVVLAAGGAAPRPLAALGSGSPELNARIRGVRHLDRLTRELRLEWFLVTSSVAAVWGSPGLAEYAAGCAFQDAVVRRRVAAGFPGLSLAWGPWTEGLVSADERARFARGGVHAFTPAEGAALLARVGGGSGHLVLARVDWPTFRAVAEARRPRPLLQGLGPPPGAGGPPAPAPPPAPASGAAEGLAATVAAVLAEVLGRPEPLDAHRGFFDAGLDSLLAVELATRLAARLGLDLPRTLAFDHPTPARLVAELARRLGRAVEAPAPARAPAAAAGPVAIVGMACRFPGAPDVDAYWELLRSGGDAVGELPPGRWSSPPDAVTRHGGFLEDVDRFDAGWFGLGEAEATAMDPQQRLLLELAVEALERAGTAPDRIRDTATGVFVGAGRSEYGDRLRTPDQPGAEALWAWSGTGNAASFLAGRLAWQLGARGPALALDTACSSSLVALHLACGALRGGECERALVGGVNLLLDPAASAWLARIGALSPSGRCRTFDAAADGYVRSEGAAVVVLRRAPDAEEDGEPVLALVLGSAVGHDGASAGVTVPTGPAQEQVIRAALAAAGLVPDDVDAVECHGTGTPLGDPIEVGALAAVFAGRGRPLLLGAVKTQIGHAEAAAGLAGVIKVVLALHHGRFPGNLHQVAPNPALPPSPALRVPALTLPWDGRVAGVSAFGISGTNAHALLGRAPAPPEAPPPPAGPVPIPMSGHTPAALSAVARAVSASEAHPADLAWTLARGRSARRHRLVRIGDLEVSDQPRLDGPPRIGFLCLGDGDASVGIGELRELPAFAEAFDRCAAVLGEGAEEGRGAQVTSARAAAREFTSARAAAREFALEWSLAQVLLGWGLRPVCFAGEGVGEHVAACLAGAVTLEEGLEACRRPPPTRAAPGEVVRAALDQRADVLIALGPYPPDFPPDFPPGGPPLDPEVRWVAALDPDRPARVSLLAALGAAWARGAEVRWEQVLERRPLVALPTTAWQRARYWVDGPTPLVLYARRWVPASLETGADARVVRIPDGSPGADPAGAILAAARALPEAGRTALVGRGAAAGGLLASWAQEHPERADTAVDADDPATAALTGGLPPGPVRVRGGRLLVPRLERWTPGPSQAKRAADGSASPLRTDLPVLVTGGAGALGGAVARWLLGRGVPVVLVGRRETPATVPAGARYVRCDLADPARVRALVFALGAIQGVFHGAGEAPAELVERIGPAAVEAALAGKVRGAVNLDRELGDVGFFVLFGSAIAWLGAVGAGAYGAANAALEDLAEARRARGRHAVCLHWGPWQSGLSAGRSGEAWDADGVRRIDEREAVAVLEVALGDAPACLAPLAVDWDRLAAARPGGVPAMASHLLRAAPAAPSAPPVARDPALVRAHVQAAVDALAGRPVGPETGFFDAGLDSLAAVELARRLSAELALPVPPALVFEAPTVESLAGRVSAGGAGAEAPVPASSAPRPADEPIAVVGLAVRLPGAASLDELGALLRDGATVASRIPESRWDADAFFDPARPSPPGRSYTDRGAFLADIDQFDPELFGMAPREAASLDPQQRLLLEVCLEALEDAGQAGEALRGSRTGVFVAVADRGWLRRFSGPASPTFPDAWAGTGTEPSFAAGRVAHTFGLRGPTVALNTTCSSALVCAHLARRSLLAGECDRALVGAASLILDPEDLAYLCQLGALSPTGACHTFDARADGYLRGEGGGALVLRRLSAARADGDRVLAVVRGSAVNHDGPASALTVPSGDAQAAVLAEALADAGLAPDEVDALECHGTGTPLGDPIEVRALRRAYQVADRARPLVLGAVKANLGHLELAAGIASLARAVVSLREGRLPPIAGLGELNPDLETAGLVLPRELVAWPDLGRARRIGVSGFGLSGTNAHLVLEQAPADSPRPACARPVHLVALSASSAAGLARLDQAWSGPAAPPSGGLAAAAAVSTTGRPSLPWRRARVVADVAELRDHGGDPPPRPASGSPPRVAMLFTGQGSQYPGMALALARVHPAFGRALARAGAALEPHLGRPLQEVLGDEGALADTAFAQPALWAVEVALADLWESWGIRPEVVVGHSVGQLAAACFAGLVSLEEGARWVCARGRLMGSLPAGGAMAAFLAPEDRVAPLARAGLSVAAVNHPEETVLSGPSAALEAAIGAATAAGVEVRRLAVSHAFHSALVDPILDTFEAETARIGFQAPRLTLLSDRTGEPMAAPPPAAWWREHARGTVRFADAVRRAAALGCDAFVEVGPHPVLLGAARRTLTDPAITWAGSLRRGSDDLRELYGAVGALWERGARVDWAAFEAPWPRVKVDVPHVPADRRRFWLPGDRYQAPGHTWAVEWVATEGRPTGRAADGAGAGWRVLVAGPRSRALAEAVRGALQDGDDRVLDLRAFDLEDPVDQAVAVAATLAGLAADPRPYWAVTPRAGAVVRGMVRSAHAELPALRGGVVELDTADPAALLACVASGLDEVRWRDGAMSAPRLVPTVLTTAPPPIRGTWLVTGGLGHVGGRIARWLASQGAESLVLTGRAAGEGAAVEALRAACGGVPVHAVAADVTDAVAMGALLATYRPRGVVHAAGVSLPQAVGELDEATVRATLGAKVEGARVLDRLTRAHPVDHLVLIGSIAGVWGGRDLTAYAGANHFLDALAEDRALVGLPAVAVDFGPWAGGGMVDPERAARLERTGQRLLSPERALAALGRAMAGGPRVVVAHFDRDRFLAALEAAGPRVLFDALRPPPVEVSPPPPAAPTPADPAARRRWLRGRVEARAREVLRLDPGRELPPERPLAELGFDSLMATELRNALLADGVDAPLGRLLGGPSVEEIAVMAEARAAPTDVPAAAAPDPGGSVLVWTHLTAVVAGAGVGIGLFVLLSRFLG